MSSIKITSSEYQSELNGKLASELKDNNIFTLPQIKSLSINVGVGRYEKKDAEEIEKILTKLTGQKVKKIATKKSIAGFKLRAGMIVGLQVTLRGKKVYDFLLKLIYSALPRGRDFKGLKADAFDSTFKTYSIGLPSATIFPEVGFGGVDFGMQINIVFKDSNKNNIKVLNNLNFPFSK